MKFEMFQQVGLARDLPDKKLQKGDVATIVDRHPAVQGEIGYSIEVFNALGDTILVTAVPESYLQQLSADEVLHVRRRRTA
jgi:uncharacterized protein DUF4926